MLPFYCLRCAFYAVSIKFFLHHLLDFIPLDFHNCPLSGGPFIFSTTPLETRKGFLPCVVVPPRQGAVPDFSAQQQRLKLFSTPFADRDCLSFLFHNFTRDPIGSFNPRPSSPVPRFFFTVSPDGIARSHFTHPASDLLPCRRKRIYLRNRQKNTRPPLGSRVIVLLLKSLLQRPQPEWGQNEVL